MWAISKEGRRKREKSCVFKINLFFPTPYSLLPTPYSLLPILKKNATKG
ncbi:MAG: hypothetical protein F6K39_36445 [Okeania sp. SIO3B3]|nr:hypothetical protein [Okeania sp. SIO3B3]